MNNKLDFVKMQATGNDFVLIDARSRDIDWTMLSIKMCRNHFDVGADGLIIIQSSSKADLKMRIFNADGSEAQICGNGLRCFAKYVIDRQMVSGTGLTVETLAGIKLVETTLSNGKVTDARVNMGKPNFKASEIPVAVEKKEPILDHMLEVSDKRLEMSFVSMGNPHAVCFIKENVDKFPLIEIGPLVEHNSLFPQRTNFEIVNVVDNSHLKARVWERGVGETLACGSGACATAVISRAKAISGDHVDIILPGGTLTISWDGSTNVFLKGPVEEVFTGEYLL